MFDPYKALAGLESLVDLARDNADARTKRFSTILRQCRPLLGKPHFQSILLKLVGDKEDAEVAKAIQKSLRPPASWGPSMASRSPGPGFSHRSPDFRYAPRPPPTCFAGVATSQDFAQGTKLFLFAFVALICRINVLCLDMRCVLFYSGIFSLGHFRYQFARSGTGSLNNTRYPVCGGVPGSA